MAEPTNERVAKTGKSGLLLLIIGIAIVAAAVAVGVIFATHPEILANVLLVIVIILVAIVAIVAVVAIAMFVLAIPFYVIRGERYQENVDYGIDEVESVEDKKNKDQGGH